MGAVSRSSSRCERARIRFGHRRKSGRRNCTKRNAETSSRRTAFFGADGPSAKTYVGCQFETRMLCVLPNSSPLQKAVDLVPLFATDERRYGLFFVCDSSTSSRVCGDSSAVARLLPL